MEWIVLNRTEEQKEQTYWQYDEEGNPIAGTETFFFYIMVYTLVEYFFPQYDTKVQVEINHFNPQSEEEIDLGIYNMGITEEKKIANQQ